MEKNTWKRWLGSGLSRFPGAQQRSPALKPTTGSCLSALCLSSQAIPSPPGCPSIPQLPGHLTAAHQAETRWLMTHLWGFVYVIPPQPFPGRQNCRSHSNESMICLHGHNIWTCLRRVHVGQTHLSLSEAASTGVISDFPGWI